MTSETSCEPAERTADRAADSTVDPPAVRPADPPADSPAGRPAGEAPGHALALLNRAATAARQYVEQAALREEALSWTAFVVLRLVWSEPRVETRQAAADAGIAKGTLTGVVDGLADRDLVRRVPHPDDGRLVLLELTDAGQRLVSRLMRAVDAAEAAALSGFDDTQVSQLDALLDRLVRRLEPGGARRTRARGPARNTR